MRTTETRYPVDRYLVESSKRYDMNNIIDDDIWNSEPALRPEDEIILRKLHDMLQSTADDLKLLSGELSKHHESGVQKKALSTPLDQDFNEKVHIEKVVNAKFYGHKLDVAEQIHRKLDRDVADEFFKSIASKSNAKQYTNQGVQVNNVPAPKKPSIKKDLTFSHTNIIQINENSTKKQSPDNSNKFDNVKNKKGNSILYNDFTHTCSGRQQITTKNKFQIQEMPSINIRSELREQKVLQLDIIPEKKDISNEAIINTNALVIEMKHEDVTTPLVSKNQLTFNLVKYIPNVNHDKPITRKVFKMSACESSESTNIISSESQNNFGIQKNNISTTSRISPRVVLKHKMSTQSKKELKRPASCIVERQKKLNTVYGGTLNLRNSGVKARKVSTKKYKKNIVPTFNKTPKVFNNTEYIPYSKLTIGGVNVGDIESEISNIPNRNEIVLSPILDKILSSRENSFHNDSPRRKHINKNFKIFSTSDENLLHEVLEIEKQVTETLAEKNLNNASSINNQDNKNNPKDGDSYDDDFEDEKSYDFEQAHGTDLSNSATAENIAHNDSSQDGNCINEHPENIPNLQEYDTINNKTYTKMSNLSLKNSIDIYEFVHTIDTQEVGIQSNTTIKVSPRAIQTSPKNDKNNMQPIHNDLWPSIDPRGEVEKMLKLEKDFIQKLIIDEYSDLLEKQFNKPSSSKNMDNENSERNVIASQKNTQTSPAHVKSVMTSPTRTKTRTTSPFLTFTVDKQTSPVIVVSNEELKVEIENNDDLGLSVNLSSPRFNLRLPQTSQDAYSNIKPETYSDKRETKQNNLRKNMFSSSSSVDGDYSSSDMSSIGEINKIYQRKLRKSRIPSISELSSSLSRYSSDPSAVIPFKSEGEASIGQINKKKSKENISEGEISFVQ